MKIFGQAMTAALLPFLLLTAIPAIVKAQVEGEGEEEHGWHDPDYSLSIADVLREDGSYSTLVRLAESVGLMGALDTESPLTLFAPKNDAWVRSYFDPTVLEQPAWSYHTLDLLSYHAVGDRLWRVDFFDGQRLPSLQGEEIDVTSAGRNNPTELNFDATVDEHDTGASNGVVHKIDRVLLPTWATTSLWDYINDDPQFSIFKDLVERADMVDVLNTQSGPMTLMAPNDAAFNYISDTDQWYNMIEDSGRIRNLVNYHIGINNYFEDDLQSEDSVPTRYGADISVSQRNGNIFLDGESRITSFDNLARNGVVNHIDRALMPPPINEELMTIAGLMESEGLDTFLNAARQTGLYNKINNNGKSLTAFGSVNAGFYPEFATWLGGGWLGHLTAAMDSQIVDEATEGLLFFSDDLSVGTFMNPLYQPTSITVTQNNPTKLNNLAEITEDDLDATNGVLHITNKVIVPPFYYYDVIDVLARRPDDWSTMVYLLIATGTIPELVGGGPYTVFAPNNEAFELCYPGLRSDWMNNLDTMADILKYHIVPQNVYEADMIPGRSYTTLQGSTLTITADTSGRRQLTTIYDPDAGRPDQPEQGPVGSILIDGRAKVLEFDIYGNNGVVHMIDQVLFPNYESNRPQGGGADVQSAPDGQICFQWGGFDEICCPTDGTATSKQGGDGTEYCEYLVNMEGDSGRL